MNDEKRADLLNTASIAELYEKQGHTMDALSVYYYLKDKDPEGFLHQNKIDALEDRAVSEKEKRVVNLLNEWLEVMIPEERAKTLSKLKESVDTEKLMNEKV